MDTASSSPPEKTSKWKSGPSNTLNIKPRTNYVNNVKINRNYKQKSNSGTEDQESSKGEWWQKTVDEMPFSGRLFTKLYTQEGLLNPVKRTFNFERKGKGSSSTSESQSRARLTPASLNPLTLAHVEKNMSSFKALENIIKKKTIPPISQKH
ncbi:protein STPG4 isoform X2 [Mobula birostris]|uniref:protein STPG4 isoform X2 n=1 Tax=Mobula birostris TaxID=1983395 RepID=UPI003B28C86D